MTEIEIRQAVFDALHQIAPEADPRKVGAEENLREALDIDSFDFLNVMLRLHDKLGVDIPEADYAKLATLGAAVDYLEMRLTSGQRPSDDS